MHKHEIGFLGLLLVIVGKNKDVGTLVVAAIIFERPYYFRPTDKALWSLIYLAGITIALVSVAYLLWSEDPSHHDQ